MARIRDYAAEYARRKANSQKRGFTSYYAERINTGKAVGLSRAQAAGTPRKGELPASIARTKDTKHNWIATAIKEIYNDVNGSGGFLDDEQLETVQNITDTYQKWRKGGWRDDKLRHELNNEIRDYQEIYDDGLDYKGGEGDSPK